MSEKLIVNRIEYAPSECMAMTSIGLEAIQPPKYSEWRIELVKGTYWQVLEGGEKCWLHRKMQELFFGIKWMKVKRND